MQRVSSSLEVAQTEKSRANKPPARYYRPELDVLRFFAFLLVFAHHILPISFAPTTFRLGRAVQEGGAAGVCLFFTLSAFLITELLLRERELTGTVHLRSFYIRRILRIWPLYFVVVTLSLALSIVAHQYASGARFLLPFLLLSGNWAVVYHHAFPPNPILSPLWSISVEEQFYLLWPTLVLFFRTRGIVAAAVLILPLAWATDLLIPVMRYTKEPDLWCNSISQFQFFALGGLLALSTHRRPLTLRLEARLLCLVVAMAALLAASYPCHFLNPVPPFHAWGPILGYLLIDAGCLLVLCAFLGATMPGWTRPLIYLGKISYGLYVFHYVLRLIVGRLLIQRLHLPPGQPAMTAMLFSITLLITIGLAAFSYQFLEKPFLRLKDRFTLIATRSA